MIIRWTSDSPKDYLIRAGHLFKHKIYKIAQKIKVIFNKNKKGDPALLNNSYTYNLQMRLFSGYDCWIRPVLNPDTKTNVTLDFTLLQLVSMVGNNYILVDIYIHILIHKY